jgi:hypothetical protein
MKISTTIILCITLIASFVISLYGIGSVDDCLCCPPLVGRGTNDIVNLLRQENSFGYQRIYRRGEPPETREWDTDELLNFLKSLRRIRHQNSIAQYAQYRLTENIDFIF